MYQPPPYQQRPPSQGKNRWLIGCGVLIGLFVLLVACGTLIEATKDPKSTSSKTVISPSAPSSPVAAESSPPTPSASASPTPSAISVDKPAKRACAANVQAVALRKAGWTAKATAKDDDAESAASESQVPAFLSLQSVDSAKIPAMLHSWCVKHLPDVKAKPVAKKPTPKPKPTEPAEPRTDPRYGTCREANAHGYGDYQQGVDPEYDWYQDRDGDGVVCET